METSHRVTKSVLCAILVWLPAAARPAALLAQAQAPEPAPQAEPQAPPPAEPPPSTPAPPPPPVEAQPQPAPAAPPGQWVYTQQYGWVWMVYGDAYVYAPPGGYGEPLAYLYYPRFGWRWVVAPWVWGAGPWPYFGALGPRHFAWYGHGWWRTPARWHFRPARVRGGVAAHGIRPAPVRRERRERGHGERGRR